MHLISLVALFVHMAVGVATERPRFGVIVWATSGYARKYASVISHNRAWAAARGYGFVLDSRDYDADLPPPRARHWGKVLALRSALRQYEAVMFIDADCAVANISIRLEWFVDRLPRFDGRATPYDVVLSNYDAPEAGQALWVNSAVMLLRRTAWSFHFLTTWWQQGEKARWFGHDQGGLWNALLELGLPSYDGACARSVAALEPHLLRQCVTTALGGRSAADALSEIDGRVRLLRASAPAGSVEATHRWARGFHFWSSLEISLHRWVSFTQPFPQLYFAEGDFIVQSRNAAELACAACMGRVRQRSDWGRANAWPTGTGCLALLTVTWESFSQF